MKFKAISNFNSEDSPPCLGCSGKYELGEFARAKEVLRDKKRRWLSQATTVITPTITYHGL